MIVIETCTRPGDWWLDSDGKEQPKYHAQIKGNPAIWAAGKSQDEAIGDLIRCHPETFGIKVQFKGKQSR